MKVVEIGKDQSVSEAIDSFKERADHFDAVILIATSKDGTQYLRSSNTSVMQKSFMLAFAHSWLMKWFQSENDT